MLERLARSAHRLATLDEDSANDIAPSLPNLFILRHDAPTDLEASLYEPVICLIIQGRKETILGSRTFSFGPGECLLVSHDVPVVSRITEAPYLALILTIDSAITRGLYEDLPHAELDADGAEAMDVDRASPGLLDALARYMEVAESEADARVLGPLISKEIHYRLLTAPQGAMLRRLLRHDSHASAIARAIARIRRDFRAPMAMPDVAREVGMSVSAFHKHFKTVTSTTPLQYQKELRLLEAKRLLTAGGGSVSTIAFEVGYASPNQFSREYARKFGVPPKEHLSTAAA